jgi:hypothetical protein
MVQWLARPALKRAAVGSKPTASKPFSFLFGVKIFLKFVFIDF